MSWGKGTTFAAVSIQTSSVLKSEGGLRLIHDLSFPVRQSVNDHSSERDKSAYESVDTAVSMLTPCYYMAKVDLESAYTHVPIHPCLQLATDLKWTLDQDHTVYMYEAKLPFGAPTIFCRITQRSRITTRLQTGKVPHKAANI